MVTKLLTMVRRLTKQGYTIRDRPNKMYTFRMSIKGGPQLDLTVRNTSQLCFLIPILEEYKWLTIAEIAGLDPTQSIGYSADDVDITIIRLS